MEREQLAFLLYEQASRDFLAEFLDVEVEDIEDADDTLLLQSIKEKVNSLTDKEFKKTVSENVIG